MSFLIDQSAYRFINFSILQNTSFYFIDFPLLFVSFKFYFFLFTLGFICSYFSSFFSKVTNQNCKLPSKHGFSCIPQI